MAKRTLSFSTCAGAIMAVLLITSQSSARAPQRSSPRPPATTSSEAGRGASIIGRVVLPSGHPVNGRVRITLSTLNDPGLALYTDDNGAFVFPNLNAGTYYIEATSDAKLYDPATEQINLLRGMTSINVTIYLREKSQKTGNSASANVVSLAEIDPNVPAAAKKEYQQGSNLANQGHIEESVERFKKAISLYPEYLVARNDLGVQYLKLNRVNEAVEQFEAAIETNSKAFNPRLNLGIARLKQKRYVEAADNLKMAYSIDSSSPAAHLYLGIALVETDEVEAAQKELATALSMGGDAYSIAHYYLAHVHMKKGEREQTIRELNTYIEKSPNGEQVEQARHLLDQLKQ